MDWPKLWICEKLWHGQKLWQRMFWHYDSEYGKERKKYYLENAICKKQETLDENRSCVLSLSRPSLSKPCICKTSIMNKFVLHDKNKTKQLTQCNFLVSWLECLSAGWQPFLSFWWHSRLVWCYSGQDSCLTVMWGVFLWHPDHTCCVSVFLS